MIHDAIPEVLRQSKQPFLEVKHYINGEFVDGGTPFEVLHPATNQVIGMAPEGKQNEIAAAVEAARVAYKTWSRMPVSERRTHLRAFAQGIRESAAELEFLESLDVGRPIRETRTGYVQRMANNIEFFADFAVTHGSEAYPMENGYINYVQRSPVGVAALITPWNMPMMLSTWKLGPTLAFGNTAVLKPAELTPVGAWKLAEIAHRSGLPKGVFNVVHGFGPDSAGAYLTEHPDVDLISFTGETTTGKIISRVAVDGHKRTSMELGGKGANIIFADADLDRVVDVTMRAGFFNQGEVCLAGSRILVERSVHDELLERFAKAAKGLQMGNVLDMNTTLGALISTEHLERVEDFARVAVAQGAEIVTGGSRPDLPGAFGQGNFFQPTLLTGVKATDRIAQEEVFGPVIPVIPFDGEDEAIALANGTPYGLNAVLQTSNVGRTLRVSSQLEVGTVWVNDWFVRDLRVPFGGAKASGMGREGGHYGYEFYLETKNICIANK
jgi:aminomuconate-semialdehyde/2-hydroxymuconate-6-semialdehyde dehydrogenase